MWNPRYHKSVKCIRPIHVDKYGSASVSVQHFIIAVRYVCPYTHMANNKTVQSVVDLLKQSQVGYGLNLLTASNVLAKLKIHFPHFDFSTVRPFHVGRALSIIGHKPHFPNSEELWPNRKMYSLDFYSSDFCRLPFGKYKGTRINELTDLNYLLWLLDETHLKNVAIRSAITRRVSHLQNSKL